MATATQILPPVETLPTLRKRLESFKPKIKTTLMADLRLVNPAVLEVSGKEMPMTRDAVKGMCKLVEPPLNLMYYKKLYSKDKGTWLKVMTLIASQKKKPITLVANNNRIIACVNKPNDLIKHTEVVDVAEELLNHLPAFQLGKTEFNGAELNIHLLNKYPFDTGTYAGALDKYRWGLVLRNHIVDGYLSKMLLERINCFNLSYVEEIAGTKQTCASIDKTLEFFMRQDKDEIANLTNKQVQILKSHNASVQELFDIRHFFKQDDGDERPYMKDYAAQLRFGDIANAYNIDTEQLSHKAKQWRQTAKTPFILYDLFNWLTQIAHEDKRFTQAESTYMRTQGGELLFRKPDMANIAPEIKQIEKMKWNLSMN